MWYYIMIKQKNNINIALKMDTHGKLVMFKIRSKVKTLDEAVKLLIKTVKEQGK